jgi:hypothetical protein
MESGRKERLQINMSKKNIIATFIFCSLSALLWMVYFALVQNAEAFVHRMVQSEGTGALDQWVYEFYPRLKTEKWRFNEVFFSTKLHQLAWRNVIFIQIILFMISYWFLLKEKVLRLWYTLFDVSIAKEKIKYITWVLYGCVILVMYDAMIDFQNLSAFQAFYSPIGIGKILLPYFPTSILLWVIYVTLWISILAVFILPYKWVSGSLTLIAFIYYQLIFFGFDKYDHGYTTLTYALMVYPFILYSFEQNKEKSIPAWPIVLIQLLISLSYFYSGMEKVLISGWAWITANTLQQHLLIHDTHWGLQLAQYTILCQCLSIATIAFQCTFILLPFFKSLRYVLLPAGIVFHTCTWIFLGAGGIINPWWVMYLFFLFPLQALEIKSNQAELQ